MSAPPNNLFADAQIIGGESGAVSGTTFDATQEGSEPAYITNDQSVWYKFTCPTTGWYRFTVPQSSHAYHGVFGSDFSQGCLALLPNGTLTQMTVANAIADYRADLAVGSIDNDFVVAGFLTATNTYYIRLSATREGSTFNSGTFDFDFLWEKFDPPATDDFVNIEDLGAPPITVTTLTVKDATFQTGSESVDQAGTNNAEQSVWYKFTPSASGKYRINIPKASIVPNGHGQYGRVTLQVSTGSSLATYQAGEIGTFGFWTHPSFFSNPEISTYIDLTSGTTYYLRAYSQFKTKLNGQGEPGFNFQTAEFDLEIELIDPPANDDYANATALTPTAGGTLTSEHLRDATEEASEPSLPYTREQSVWYKITPAVTGKYRFRIPLDSLDYEGYASDGNGELSMSLAPAAGITNHVTANCLPDAWYTFILKYPESGWQNPHNAIRVADLTAATEYRIKVTANGGTSFDQFNSTVMAFDLEWELLTPNSNDDFANALTITGSSGTQDFDDSGNTGETNEPRAFYWDDDGFGHVASDDLTSWFKWVAPSSGWFLFSVESLAFGPASYSMSIYTGTTLTGLTRVNNGSGGTHPETTNPQAQQTTIAINAVSGTEYKIQVVGWSFEGESRLSWATTSAPTGDTGATAVSGQVNGRVNNYGNTDNDLPPNAVTLLSGHGQWWYNDGAVGKTKWFKYTAPEDLTIRISGVCWADSPPNTTSNIRGDIGLIAYKGATFGSLTVAQAHNKDDNVDEDVAMLQTSFAFYDGDNVSSVLATNGDNYIPDVVVAAGETIWICLFGLYDNDLFGDASVAGAPMDATEFDIDLKFGPTPPPNDIVATTPIGSPTYAYILNKTHWDTDLVYGNKFAGQIAGTTFGATAEVGEPAHAGYGPTRSVWFELDLTEDGDTKIWVESTEDCVLSVYDFDATPDVATLNLIDEDDDSGTGNWPEVIISKAATATGELWVCVDAKAECNFVLKYEWQNDNPVIPANNDFDDAVVITGPTVIRGTTVGASAEYFEWDSEYAFTGPCDTVWYKYTPTETKQVKFDGRVLSNNFDGYVIVEVYTGADKDHLTKVSAGNEGGIFRGPFFPTFSNDPILLDVVNGTDYYIRVCTEEGHSEDFELWVDTDMIYLDLQPGGFDVSNLEQATIPLKLTPGGSELLKNPTTETGTVTLRLTPITTFEDQVNSEVGTIYLDLQPSGTEFSVMEAVDSGTVYLKLIPSGSEEHSHACFTGEGTPDPRFYTGDVDARFETDALGPDTRWVTHIHKGAQYC